ncbi:MAG: 4-alpha-glucanotransferase [bacterium]|jgi:4-alpha-glucanotransferase|nr:4-alpha-glucanotransferase [bacterium]
MSEIDVKASEIKDIEQYLLNSYSSEHWQNIGVRRRAGVVTPVFSLRTNSDEGAGTFADLKLLADWCAVVGHGVIQVLPINDTAGNISPYSAVTAFGLDPMLLAIRSVPFVESHPDILKFVNESLKQIPTGERVDWVALRRVKEKILADIYSVFLERVSADELNRFSQFKKENGHWLWPYAVFRSLKERFDQKSWVEWPEEYVSGGVFIDRGLEERSGFFEFVQWLLEEQLIDVKNHCAQKGVSLKGDIPILLSYDSADVWSRQEYFNLDVTAGAPPDMFSDDGQNWGFPTYKWDVLASREFDWWRERLQQAEKFLHLYRIDHVVGFFRIWTIPEGEKTGENGYFVPEDESVWEEHGRTLLKMMLDSTVLLPLAEDLGVVPPCAREVLLELGIPGTKVDRWERDWDGDGSYLDAKSFNPVSLASMSTHDTDTLRGWWQDFPEERDVFFQSLNKKGKSPAKLDQKTHDRILQRVYASSSLFALNLLQDLVSREPAILKDDPAENRINVPGADNPKNWTYRFPFTIEEMLTGESFKKLNTFLKKLVQQTDRFNAGNVKSKVIDF